MVRTTSDKTNFKDFSSIFRGQINRHSSTPFWTPCWLKHVVESFMILISPTTVDLLILYYFPQQLTLQMTEYDLQLHLRYRNSIWNKETEIKYCPRTKNVFTLLVSFIGSYVEDEQDFPRRNNLILQKTGVWHGQGSEMQGLFKT